MSVGQSVRLVLMAVMAALSPLYALGQGVSPAAPAQHRFEAAAGAGLFGSTALGAGAANLRARGGGDSLLFTTDSTLAAAFEPEIRAAVVLGRRYAVEARFAWSRPELETTVTGDVEGAPDITLAERVDRYVIDAALVIALPEWRVGRLAPFATAGAGYVRQLHEGRTLVEQGAVYHVGGGVRVAMFTRSRGVPRTAGVRADARANVLSGGIGTGDRVLVYPQVAGGFFVGF